jgi:hypothetical protein
MHGVDFDTTEVNGSQDSSLSTATGHELDGRGLVVRFPARGRDFSILHDVQTDAGAHASSYPVSSGDSFPGQSVTGVKLLVASS